MPKLARPRRRPLPNLQLLESHAGDVLVTATKSNKPKAVTREAWGILNPWGDLWSYEVFDTAEAALEHLEAFWRKPGFKDEHRDTSKYRIVKVKVRVAVIANPHLYGRGARG